MRAGAGCREAIRRRLAPTHIHQVELCMGGERRECGGGGGERRGWSQRRPLLQRARQLQPGGGRDEQSDGGAFGFHFRGRRKQKKKAPIFAPMTPPPFLRPLLHRALCHFRHV